MLSCKYILILFFSVYFISCSSSNSIYSNSNILFTSFPDKSSSDDGAFYYLEILGYNSKTKSYFRFTNDNYEDRHPSYSPNGNRILFSSKRPFTGNLSGAAPKKLYVLDIPSNQINLIDTDFLSDYAFQGIVDCDNPIWSPVSNDIAFRIGNIFDCKIIVFDIDSHKLRLIMDSPSITKISWSSTGKFIAYEGINTSEPSKNIIEMIFEVGYIDILNNKKTIIEQSKRRNWGIIGGISTGDKFLIYNIDSTNAPIKYYEYDVNTNNKKYIATTMEGRSAEIGATDYEIFFIKTAENNSQDIWSLNIKNNSLTQITFDGRYKTDLTYINK